MVIEKARIIFKNLIRMGPDLNFELFRAKLLERKFRENQRIIPTPEGPLKEYVMTEPKYLRDLIIVSRKGFVIDSRDFNYARYLINLAYEIYEETMMNYIEYIQADVVGIYDLVVLVPDARKIINNALRRGITKGINLADRLFMPFGVAFSYGVPTPPQEFIVVNITRVPLPQAADKRLKMVINYNSGDSEKALKFLDALPSTVESIIKKLSTP